MSATVADFERAQANYLAVCYYARPNWTSAARGFLGACFGRRWWKLWLMFAILFSTLAGCVAVSVAHAAEIPDRIIRGLVMVESGCEWVDIGEIRGKWKLGVDGEISHFQLTPSALREMKVEHLADRIAREPILAESMARRFLLICFKKRGNWPQALATYHRWSAYRSSEAKDYARRVLNLSTVL